MTEAGGPEQVQEILRWLDEKPSLARTTSAAQRLRELDAANSGARPVKVAVLRNFTLEPIEPYLVVAGFRAGLDIRLEFSGYNPTPGGLEPYLDAQPTVVWIALRLEDLSPDLGHDFGSLPAARRDDLCDDTMQYVAAILAEARSRSHGLVFVNTFSAPPRLADGIADLQRPQGQMATVRRLNQRLVEQTNGAEGCYILDLETIFGVIGSAQCYDARGDRTAGAPLTPLALETLAGSFVRHIRAATGPRAKCIVVDCDNTLWGGIVGEDGLGGITLSENGPGRRFQDLHRELLDLKRRGILLAICSKNEEADVLEVLRKHPDCLLREADFAAMRVNWENKASNLLAISEELNIAPEHVVFVDDDAVECDSVRSMIPSLTVVRWPDHHARSLDELGYFDSLVMTSEDAVRTDLYRAEAKRRSVQASASSMTEYLASLEIVAVVGSAREEHMARLAQLTQRTNQFNLTTRRYDLPQLSGLVESADAAVLRVELADRFGSYGTVGMGIIRVSEETATIDTLLMSCRVIGRGAETVLVNALAKAARDRGARVLVGEYIPSQRNGQVADLYTRLGFAGPTICDDASTWTWDLTTGDPAVAAWITATESEELPSEQRS